jgi:biopolymer transport protein ExbD
MPIVTPGKRPGARLQKSKVFGKKGGFAKKKSGYSSLNLTPMVDMFTIIVIYLLQNFSTDGDILFMSKDIQLPSITSKLTLERAPVVAISAESISVDGSRVVDVADLTRDETWNVPALEETMREKRRNIEQSAQLLGGKPFTGTVNIQGDKNVKFGILKKVMFACNNAGFTNLNLAGMQTTAGAAKPATASNP